MPRARPASVGEEWAEVGVGGDAKEVVEGDVATRRRTRPAGRCAPGRDRTSPEVLFEFVEFISKDQV